MSMTVVLEDEARSEIARIDDTKGNLIKSLSGMTERDLTVMGFIDPYGDTLFNRLQVPMLLADIERAAMSADEEARALLDTVAALASRVTTEPHLYLRFIGD